MPYNLKDYHPEWRDRIRPEILKRDKFRCAVCGVKQKTVGYRDSKQRFIQCDEFMVQWAKDQGIKTFTVYLSVIHLDHNKKNNEPSNLRTACQLHHNRHDHHHRKMNRALRKQTKTP